MHRQVNLGIGAISASADADTVLFTTLGSCVAVVMVDTYSRTAGLVHIALPDSTINQDKARDCPGYFADTGIPRLLEQMDGLRRRGTNRLLIKLIGGGRVLDQSNTFDIGKRNILAAKRILWELRLGVQAEDIGGEVARSIKVWVWTGAVAVSSHGREKIIL